MRTTGVVLSMILSGLPWQAAAATPSHVSIDLSSLGGASFQLQIALYDNSPVIGDSWALLDNVMVGSAADDFEAGTLGGFNDSLNPVSVAAVAGNLNGTGSYVLLINEDPVVTPTITFRNYASPSGSTLTFDFELVTSGASGPMGQDELVFALLNPQTLDPLVPGLTGLGDVLAVTAADMHKTSAVPVTTTQIPAPAALVLGLVGVGGIGIWRRRTGGI